MINVIELRAGNYFKDRDQIFLVLDINLNKTAMRKMIAKIKIKNVRNNSIINLTHNSGYMVELIHLEKKKMIYLYSNENFLIFMNNSSYEQIEIKKDMLKWEMNFLTPNIEIEVLNYNNEIIGISLPTKVILKIINCDPAAKTDSVKSAMKNAILETNFQIKVPMFINNNEKIYVRTDNGEYDGRI